MSSPDLEIQDSLNRAGIPSEYSGILTKYIGVLLEINTKINLTGAKSPWEVAAKHISDTFGAVQAMGRKGWPSEIWDIGSGGGIPGIPLAIFVPQIRVRLVERRQKKGGALKDLVKACGLSDRITVSIASFDALRPRENDIEHWFRGVLPGPKLIAYLSQNFLAEELGPIVLMKGPQWPLELEAALDTADISNSWRARFQMSEVSEYRLPENLGTRYIVRL